MKPRRADKLGLLVCSTSLSVQIQLFELEFFLAYLGPCALATICLLYSVLAKPSRFILTFFSLVISLVCIWECTKKCPPCSSYNSRVRHLTVDKSQLKPQKYNLTLSLSQNFISIHKGRFGMV